MKALTGKELIRLLQEHGWRVARVEGSHHILVRVGREEILSVPVHGSRNLRTGTVKGILRTARIKLDR